MTRIVLLLAVAAALAAPASTAATADPCAADTRLVNAWHKVLADNSRITARQTVLLGNMFRLLSTNQTVPPAIFDELRTLVTRNRQQLAAGERRIALIKPGTANGRELKRLVLRFVRVVARPLNTCIGRLLQSDSPDDLAGVVDCVDSTSRARVALSRDIDRSLTRMRTARARTCVRP